MKKILMVVPVGAVLIGWFVRPYWLVVLLCFVWGYSVNLAERRGWL